MNDRRNQFQKRVAYQNANEDNQLEEGNLNIDQFNPLLQSQRFEQQQFSSIKQNKRVDRQIGNQQFNKGNQTSEFAQQSYERCFHCGQRGHIFANCPYHALLTATTEEERALAEIEIQKARAAVRGQGWRGLYKRTETKINLGDQQNNSKQEDNQNQDIHTNENNEISRDVSVGLCFRCGRPGHKSKNCKYEDKRICYTCGKIGHVSKQCPSKLNQKDQKNLQQLDKK
ncbi:MAG: hypothetical protein EZS28_018924 [Streblomastix strix]|uniref:CCHC-type domain-containing protein n=1 Tax=Streblomastix strix TaxID=222440 RepID=A0A5J4VSZ0_9EUKA|nr:MAG: hypothetical protein EZS28_018924 [Streblomastix strix]